MKENKIVDSIQNGTTSLGIELGSTRVKSVLIDSDHNIIASGNFAWENKFKNNIWTYSLEDAIYAVQASYKNLVSNIMNNYNIELKKIGSIGISGMMHGYLVFDSDDNLLVPYRTWRNNITKEASSSLSRIFNYPIPQRWSIAHLYQAILNNEDHVPKVNYITTLAGYIHQLLTNEKVLGVGEASGMFPIDILTSKYDKKLCDSFNELVKNTEFNQKIENVLPTIKPVKSIAGTLTLEGARILDPSGTLEYGSLFCPPEGDAGTGMIATNSITFNKGNISAGTSAFAMVVLDKKLSNVYKEIDLVTTPDGKLVAMVHVNNFSSDYNAWISLFEQLIRKMGLDISSDELFNKLFAAAIESEYDAGGLLSYGYISGEHITNFDHGRPLFVREQNANFTIENFMRTLIFSSLATIRIGLDILTEEENIVIENLIGHGGFFKSKTISQLMMASALNISISVLETASEGGPWGMAVLAAYILNKGQTENFESYLNKRVFSDNNLKTVRPSEKDRIGFNMFFERYIAGLEVERSAVKHLK